MDNSCKATGVAMAKMGFKEGTEAGQEDCGTDTVNWEAFKAQEVQPQPVNSTDDWESIHHCEPHTG